MTDSLERFLQDLRFDPPAGLVERAQAAADAGAARPAARRRAHRREDFETPRPHWALALVAMLLAIAVIATLVGVRALHSRAPTPVKHGPPIALRRNGNVVVAVGNSLIAVDPVTGSRRTILSDSMPLSDPAYSSDGTKLAYLRGGGSIRVLDTTTGNIAELTTCSCGTSSNLSWSPDGSRLAYSEGGEPMGTQLYLINADGSQRTQLTHFPTLYFPWQPTWSPDGSRIAFALRDSGGIDVIKADGTGLTVVVAGAGGWSPGYPAWSPDGARIAYILDPSSAQGPFEYELWAMDPDGSHRAKLWVSPGCCVTAWGGPAWSPDATQIATVTFNTLWVMSADGSNPRSLGTVGTGERPTWQPLPITGFHNGYLVVSNGSALVGLELANPHLEQRLVTMQTGGVQLSDPAYTRDGARLAYLDGTGAIWVLDTASGRTHQLTKCACIPSSRLSWSPDGSRLAFADGGQIYLIDAAGTHKTQLTHSATGETASRPSWSPDGNRIAFTVGHDIDVIGTDGSGLATLLTGVDQPFDPAWSPDGSRIAYVLDPRSPQAPREPYEFQLWLMNADGSHHAKIWANPGCCITAIGGPAWSPDGTRIALVALPAVPPLGSGDGSFTVWVMNADGSDAQTVPGFVIGDRPAWQPVP